MTPKLQAILSYLGILWLVAYFAGKKERNYLSRYHLKKGLGLLIVGMVFNILVGIILINMPSLVTILGLFTQLSLFLWYMQ